MICVVDAGSGVGVPEYRLVCHRFRWARSVLWLTPYSNAHLEVVRRDIELLPQRVVA